MPTKLQQLRKEQFRKSRAGPRKRGRRRSEEALRQESEKQFYGTLGPASPASLNLPFGVEVATLEMWKAEYFRRGAGGTNPHRDFDRRREALQAKHLVAVDGSYVWA
jgi:hypothetical protein